MIRDKDAFNEQLNEKVSRGVALLDKVRPHWRDDIEVNKLNLMYCSSCVLGQLYGWYVGGLRELNLSDIAAYGIEGEESAEYYGLTGSAESPNQYYEFRQLTRLWKEVL